MEGWCPSILIMKRLIILSLLVCQISWGQSEEYKSFYRGNLGMQYFIKPLEYNHSDKILEIDFLYILKEYKSKDVTTNFSVYNSEKIQSITIGETEYKVSQMFIEQIDDKVHSRYTTTITMTSLKNLITGSLPIILNTKKYVPSKKTLKSLENLSTEIISNIRVQN